MTAVMRDRAPRWLDCQRRRHLSREDYAEYQLESTRGRLTDIARDLGLVSPRVLDVGCGLGGMTVAYALDGARATGIDVECYDAETIRFARAFAAQRGVEVEYLVVSADGWPLEHDLFDVVFLDSVLEHAADPARLLAETARVLRPGGRAFVSFPVFYGPFGGHLDDYIGIPWYHLLPKRVVLATLRRCRPRGEYITPEFVAGLYTSLNRLTLRRFARICRALPLDVVRMDRNAYLTTAGNQLVADVRRAVRRGDLGAAWDAVRRGPRDFRPAEFLLFVFLALSLPLMRVPIVQEAFLGGVRAVLAKPTGVCA